MSQNPDLLLICAVEREAAPLLARGAGTRAHPGPGVTTWRTTIAGRPVRVVAGGMGYTNAAHAATVALVEAPPSAVIGFGIAGAYPDSGLRTGDVVLADRVTYADVGVETDAGWLGAREIGIPVCTVSDPPLYNTFTIDPELLARASQALGDTTPRVVTGPVLSASTGSGNRASAARLIGRYPGLAEEMEGAALAHVAALHRRPFLLAKGISNRAGERDPAAWRIDDAAEAVSEVVERLVGALHPRPASAG